MKVEYPKNFSYEYYDSNYLWRYIGIHRLLDILNHGQLYFTRFDHFEDGVEGLTGKGITLKAFTQGRPLTKENVNPSFDAQTQDKIIREDQNFRQKYLDDLINSQQTQFASCWYLGNRESIAMWKLYSKTDGVALKFKPGQIIETVTAAAKSYTNSDFGIMYFGEVTYKNIWPFDPNEKFDGKFNGLKKDKSYSHEKEFRFVVVVPLNKRGFYDHFTLPIGNLSTYDLNIIANPFMEEWEFENLEILLDKYGLSGFLKRSGMDIRKR